MSVRTHIITAHNQHLQSLHDWNVENNIPWFRADARMTGVGCCCKSLCDIVNCGYGMSPSSLASHAAYSMTTATE